MNRGARVLWLIACVAAVLTVAGAARGNAPDALEQIARSFEDFELTATRELLDRYEASHGASPASLYYRARLASMAGDLQRARDLAESCLGRFDGPAICHEAFGEAELVKLVLGGNFFKQIGAARRARRSLERAVQLDADNLRARLMLVRFYTLAPWIIGGSKAKAREHVKACVERDASWGGEAQALYDLATGNPEAAVEGFAQASALRPRDRDPALFLAKAYLADNQPEAAIATLERLIAQYPEFFEAWLELGTIAARRGVQSLRGMAALEHFLDSASDASARRQAQAATELGRLYIAASRPDDAIGALRRAIAFDASYRSAKRLLSKVCRDVPRQCER